MTDLDPSTVGITLGAIGIALGIVIAGVAVWTFIQDQRRWPAKKRGRK